jgi:hypothetical protein
MSKKPALNVAALFSVVLATLSVICALCAITSNFLLGGIFGLSVGLFAIVLAVLSLRV